MRRVPIFFYKVLLGLFLTVGSYQFLPGQSASPEPDSIVYKLDSLLQEYRNYSETEPVKAKASVEKLIELSSKHNRVIYEARGHYFLCYIFEAEGKNKEAIKEGKLAEQKIREAQMDRGLSAIYNLLAIAYHNLGDNVSAMNHYLKCLELANEEDNQIEAGHAYGNIANLYIEQEQYERAKDNLQRAYEAYLEANYPDGIVATLFTMANILKDQGNNEKARNYYEQIIDYSKKSNNLIQEANARINLGQLLLSEKKYKEALPVLKQTYQLLKKLGFVSDQARVLNDLGVACKNLDMTQEAIDYFNLALKIDETESINDAVYINLSDLYAKQKNYKKAFDQLSRSYTLKDSLNNIEKDKHLAELQQKYETQLKEAQIEILEKEKSLQDAKLLQSESEVARQKQLRNAFIIGFVLVLITLVLLRYFYVQRMKVQKQLASQKEENARHKINELIKDYRLDSINKYNEGQQQERKRIAREIHDGLGSDLASLKMSFEHYMSQQHGNNALQKMLYTIQSIYKDLRSISHQLHPPAFSDHGFCDFLNQLVADKMNDGNIKMKVICFPEEEIDALPDRILAEAYRIIQELITNIIKHAEASNSEIQVTKHEDYINIVVSDNGKGMPNKTQSGIGLRNIQERLEYLGGHIDIDSSANGTTININIPLSLDATNE
ncbi:tetratricopeptide repeat protein [Fulvivirga maritima]|uniref:tetratricopeptide repeat-containing sensor histidine kinase n=1 Tax=Fulvivirga maritima TaxID=2904247 RepID=UPI001F2EF1A6|nr:tetratricopeptide repeat protein [Fulvivirga maritima]UII28318.1 tetratricopeptide repeat protein [Fulvivirga maritima]